MKRPATYSPIQAALYHQNQAKFQAMAQQAAMQQQQAMMQMAAYNNMGSLTTSTTGTNTFWLSQGTTAATTSTLGTNIATALYSSQGQSVPPTQSQLVVDTLRLMGEVVIENGEPCRITLPDGGRLVVAADGSYVLEDQDAKVTYRANRTRDFNPFINASDKLEAFIKFCGALGVKQDEMLNLPITLFIKWLIVMAAVADGEEADEEALLAFVKQRRPRCTCGRFLARERVRKKVFFCRSECMERRMAA